MDGMKMYVLYVLCVLWILDSMCLYDEMWDLVVCMYNFDVNSNVMGKAAAKIKIFS